MTLSMIVWLMISGLLIGALARLAIPGRNPMSLLVTMLVGIAGSFVGGVIAVALGLGSTAAFILAVLCAAVLVYLISGAGRRVFGGRRSVL